MDAAILANPARKMVQFDPEQILAHAGVVGVVDGVVERHSNVRVRFEGQPDPMWVPMEALFRCDGLGSTFDPESPQSRLAVALCKFGFQLAFEHMLDGGFVELG